jgi:integrase
MPRYAKKLGQIGEWWLSKRPNSPAWCRTWFDARAGQVCRASLETPDFDEAQIRLAAWFIANHRPKNAAPSETLLSGILQRYYDSVVSKKPSGPQAKIAIDRFMEFWPGECVSVLTLAEQERYAAGRRANGIADGTISRELGVLRAALLYSLKHQELASVPFIPDVETETDKAAKEPKGRPLSAEEAAALFRVSRGNERRMMLLMILFSTACRPDAARDLTPLQHDKEHGLLDLNPAGRRQTKKYRPTIPVASTLAPWLGLRTRSHYVGTLSARVDSTKTMWREIRKDAGLDRRVQPYSARHTIARELRKQRVPTDQIELLLGHRRPVQGTTGTYAPYDPEYCREAVAAIDGFFAKIEAVLGATYFRVSFEEIKKAAERFAENRTKSRRKVVGATGIEPVTPTMSR